MKKVLSILMPLFVFLSYGQSNEYLDVIKKQGSKPIQFVQQILAKNDLILFDDALHNAYEPFLFYEELLSSDTTIDYVFLEAFGLNVQSNIDAFMKSDVMDITQLIPVFQSSFSGLGWQYESYFRLLKHIWHLNQQREKKIQVVGVDQPIYWEGIHNRRDYDIFRQSLIGRDYFMYRIILDHMQNFESEKKGIFLTNTRHAYKGIKKSNNKYYWNCGTFFHQWHQGKTYAIRFHNVTLHISAKKPDGNSIDGLDRVSYSWARMEDGAWDRAFEANENKPIAIPLKGNVFGEATYIGNHMLDVAPNQTMHDAYDAIIFLKEIEQLNFSPKLSFYYTSSFKNELKRRIEIVNEGNIEAFLQRNQVSSVDEFIADIAKGQPLTSNNLLN